MKQAEEVFANVAIVLDYLISNYRDKLKNYRITGLVVSICMTICTLLVMFIVMFVFWRPYIKNLNQNMWRTRGMLNMIPMEIISNTQSLRAKIIDENLLNLVSKS